MTELNAERNLFAEERKATVGRTRTGEFVAGMKVGSTHMYLQEKLDGRLGHFKLQRRHDRVGYNQALTPFVALGSEDGSSPYNSSQRLHQTSSKVLATVKTGYNSN